MYYHRRSRSRSPASPVRSSEGRGVSPDERPKGDAPVHHERLSNSHLRIRGLTRNVTAAHVEEIMSTFGKIEKLHFAMDDELHLPRGYADVTFALEEDGTKAKTYMHDGYIDGARVSVVYRRNIGKEKARKEIKKRALSPHTATEGKRRRRSRSPYVRQRSPRRSRSPYIRPRSPRRSRSPYARRRSPGRSRSPYGWKGRKSGTMRRRSWSRSRSPKDRNDWRGRNSSGAGRQNDSRRERSPYDSRMVRGRRISRSPSPRRRSRSVSKSLTRSVSRSYSYSSRSRSTSRSYSSNYSSLSRGRSPTPR